MTDRWTVASDRGYRFDIAFVRDILDPHNATLADAVGESGRCLVVADAEVVKLYGAATKRYFSERGITPVIAAVACEEGGKDLSMLESVLDVIESFAPLRSTEPIVALGGGVLLDVVGLAAGIYRRGVPYVRVPTTLIGAVDVSVAAKTGINHFGRRNRLGLYYPPHAAYIDLAFLKTQSKRDLASGFGEIIKLAVICSVELFEAVENAGPDLPDRLVGSARMETIAALAARVMIDQLGPNLWELDLRRAVDYGHSFSPSIEMASRPQLRHGEAVFLDVLLSSAIAVGRDMLAVGDHERIEAVGRLAGLPVRHPDFEQVDILWGALEDTIRHRNGRQHLPVPGGIGKCHFVEDLSRTELTAAIRFMTAQSE